jgi:hypothetical protein
MADPQGLSTAGNVVGAVSPVLGAIPIVGGALSAVGSLASGLMKNAAAKEQAKRAEELRKKSEGLGKGALRPEYLKSLKMNEMAALYGLPGMNQYQENIDQDVANNARAIVESSPDGGVALNAINATLAKSYQAKNALYQQDALLKEQKMGKVADQMWQTGDKQMDLVAMQRADKRDLNTAAGNLENSATANRVGSIDQILSTVGAFGNTLGKLGGSDNGNISTALNKNTTLNTSQSPAMNTTNPTSNLNLSGTANAMQNLNLSWQDSMALSKKLIDSGVATSQADAISKLRSMGYNF